MPELDGWISLIKLIDRISRVLVDTRIVGEGLIGQNQIIRAIFLGEVFEISIIECFESLLGKAEGIVIIAVELFHRTRRKIVHASHISAGKNRVIV